MFVRPNGFSGVNGVNSVIACVSGQQKLLSVMALLLTMGALAAAQMVPMTKRGNVRYGPSTSAPVIITLTPGTQVQLLGPAEGRQGWYEIAFPEAGGAWMHRKVLEPTANIKEWTVAVDGASVRSDSRISAELVAQLRRGAVVRQHGFIKDDGSFQGIKVGEWLKVYPTGATAYVYQSVIGLDAASQAKFADARPVAQEPADPWQRALQQYNGFRQAYEDNQQEALLLDWQRLADDLQNISQGHQSQAIRVDALRLLKAVRSIVPHARRAQAAAGVQPKPYLPSRQYQAPPVAVPVQQVPAQPQQPTQQPAQQPAQQQLTQQQPTPPPQPTQPAPTPAVTKEHVQQNPAQQPDPVIPQAAPAQPAQPVVVDLGPEPTTAAPAQLDAAPTVAGGNQASIMGWLEQRDVAGQTANHVLIDGNGSVCAVVAAAPGADLGLAQYFWRRVTATGSTEVITVDGQDVPLLTATSVRLTTR